MLHLSRWVEYSRGRSSRILPKRLPCCCLTFAAIVVLLPRPVQYNSHRNYLCTLQEVPLHLNHRHTVQPFRPHPTFLPAGSLPSRGEQRPLLVTGAVSYLLCLLCCVTW